MKIHNISYYDHEIDWGFENIDFSQLTLLVGVSGVGKTKILQSIMNLKKIAEGASLNGVEWKINFTDNDNIPYYWEGKFKTREKYKSDLIFEENQNDDEFPIVYENLFINGKKVIERKNNQIKFKEIILPKLSSSQSVVEILNEEDYISIIQKNLKQIIFSNQSTDSLPDTLSHVIIPPKLLNKLLNLKPSLVRIKESSLPIFIKFVLIFKYYPEIFNQIRKAFIDIFLQVEDIQLEIKTHDDFTSELEYINVSIRETNVNYWIDQDSISSGMLRTLIHIAEIYLSPKGSLILIDEFENSLGVNCIDVVTDLILENRDIQFIITSHHPYIINNIPMDNWKIVTRKGGVVEARDAKDFDLGKSRHQSFMQLMNLDAYKEGINVG